MVQSLDTLTLLVWEGLLRDSERKWIGDFYRNIEIINSLAFELWGLRDSLILAQSLHICKLIIEIDVKSVVYILKSENILNTNSHSL
jgi:hypothetical protein